MNNFIISCKNNEPRDISIKVLKEKLILSIEENGINSIITISLSQELDRLIVAKMSEALELQLMKEDNT